MNPDLLFTLSNAVALASWLVLAFASRWKYARAGIFSGVILLLAALYTLLIASTFLQTTEGGFGSLDQVAKLFENRVALLAGWVHYLAFDLLVGCWISADAQRNGIPQLAVIPCLFVTFMFGPLGYLLYRVTRLYKNPKWLIDVHA